MAELPSGTVTFLFTDLEGSTRLWEEHPQAMRGALARHDEILHEAIAAHDGYVVKMTGDGAHAAFANATGAVCAARDAQLALVGETWEGTGPLRVRMGIHTGPAQCRDGDYYGTAVNRAARLMSVAHGGQVLVSLTTEELLRDDTAEGWSLADVGEHRLRDLARAEHVFQLCALGLPDEFPPLDTLDAFAGNLPTQLTSFIGRDEELKSVADTLTSSRLVTLIGVGGVGKTRLALQVAAEVLPRYRDGAWLVELANASDGESMVQVVAASLGVSPRGGMSLAGAIVDFLRMKQLLIVLDNCEHLLEQAASVTEEVLRECRGVAVLATSREGLAIAGEQVWPLRSLAVPKESSTDAVAANAATLLFIERARAVSPSFTIERGNATAVAEVCRRLDGIPLAIELAAARANVMTPTEIASLLDERFRLLTGGRRTAVERHQTLRAMVDWSYSLLEERERDVFDRLGVFSGSFDAEAAVAVAASDDVDVWDVRECLRALVDRSMVSAEQTAQGTRYSMLETLRQYARERLDDRSESDMWRRQHAVYYGRLAGELGRGLLGPDEVAVRNRFHADLDNLRAAVTWALDRDDRADVELGIAIVAELAMQALNDLLSGVALWAARAFEFTEHSPPAYRHAVGAGAGIARLTYLADLDGARTIASDVVKDGIPASSPAASLGHEVLGEALAFSGDDAGADTAFAEGRRLLEEIAADPYFRSSLEAMASSFHYFWGTGDSGQARAEAEVAVALARTVDNPTALAFALFALACSTWASDPTGALGAAEESAALTRAGAGDAGYPPVLSIMARLHLDRGETAEACAALRYAVEHMTEVGVTLPHTLPLNDAAILFLEHGRADVAAQLAGALHDGVLAPVAQWVRGRDETRRLLRVAAGARDVLGDTDFEAEHEKGAGMSNEELTNLLLATLDALSAEAASS